jgi:hypothetical protein
MKTLLLVFLLLFTFQAHANQSNPKSDYPYEILGADPAASDDALAEAWRTALKAHHPDRGGTTEDVRNIIEAYQFLKEHRELFDGGLLPFRGLYKREETRPVLLDYQEILKYQIAYLGYIRAEDEARELAGSDPEDHPVFLMYAVLNLRGDHDNYLRFQPWQLRAYRELLYHFDLLRLTKSELSGIVLHDPVHALYRLLDHYDNFNVRRSTLNDLFSAYNEFYVSDERKSVVFIRLIDRLERSHRLYESRFTVIREAAVTSLKRWVTEYYYGLPADKRIEKRSLYLRARRLILRLEPFSNYVRDCGRLMIGRRLQP